MLGGDCGPNAHVRATIVIADDDDATRRILCRVLERENFRVVAVENGKLACEAVLRERPDVVLLDWVMPVMDGRAALAVLKGSTQTRGIPIVMLTSNSQVDERIIALEAGVQDFLSKPFEPRELVACIEQQLRRRDYLAIDADAAFLAERDALRAASERRYRFLAEAMPHIVWIADPRGDVKYFSRAWYDYTGTVPDDVISAGWAPFVHADDRASALLAWSESLRTGRPYEAQVRLRRAFDGMYRWHLAQAIPTREESGSIAEWVVSCTDIHDYRIANETRVILDTMGSIVAIRGDDGFVDYAGPYWSQYTGSAPGSALGFGWRAFVHPDDLEHIDGAPKALNVSRDQTRQYELRFRGADRAYQWFQCQTTMLPHAADETPRWLDTATNVDDLKRTQLALKNSETRYRALTDSMPQMVWVVDAAANVEYVNRRWSDYTGLDLGRTRALGPETIVHVEDVAALEAMRTHSADTEYTCEARFRRHDGVFRWQAIRTVSFDDAAGDDQKWIGTATDIEDSKAAALALADTAAELEHLAHHDPMTNLPNRILLVERLAQAITLAQRAKTEVLVLYIDLDRFKLVNDTLGHAAGDRVLAVTGERIAEALRTGDMASRVGGDEFVLVCATAEATQDAARLATRLIDAIGRPIDIDGESVSVGASIGISMYPADAVDGDELIRKADSAMYAAKQSGRNLYHADTHSSIVAAIDFESELHAAIALKQIVVHYQPIVSLTTNQLIGAEALARWQHPVRGLLYPVDFLGFAEEHRLSGEIDAIVLAAVCIQIAALGPQVSPDFRISMNVSLRQLMQPGWVRDLAATLAKHRADPFRLEIEIAESVVTSEPSAVVAVLDELRALGISLSIDDFGTGVSSLASIKSFPLHSLKIDRSFVADIVNSSSDQAVAKAIIMLAHSLGLNVIAAGVETQAQVAALRAFGSDGFQGYLASRPMPPADFTAFLALERSSTLALNERGAS